MKKPVPPTTEERLQQYYCDDAIQFQYSQIDLIESLGQSAKALRENKDRMIREKFVDIYDLIKEIEKKKGLK